MVGGDHSQLLFAVMWNKNSDEKAEFTLWNEKKVLVGIVNICVRVMA